MGMEGYVEVAECGSVVYVRVAGCASMNNFEFKEYSDLMFKEGFRGFVVDLGDCKHMDSSFMGTLVGIQHLLGAEAGGHLVIANAGEHCLGLLRSLGIDRIVCVREEAVEFPAIGMERLRQGVLDRAQRATYLLETHQALATLSEENARVFGPVLECLKREIAEGRHLQ